MYINTDHRIDEASPMAERKSIVAGETIIRRCSVQNPSAIVQLDESNIILVDNHTDDENDDDVLDIENPPLIHATPSCGDLNLENLQEPLLQTEAYPMSNYTRDSTPYACDIVEAVPVGHTRPEFIYVQVNKPSPDSKLGIFLKGRRGGGVRISRINPVGLFGKCPLEKGDVLVAVNGYSCVDAAPADVSAFVRKAKETVSVLVRNENGNPLTASSTVQKPTIESKVGIAMKDKRGAIIVSRIHDKGSFAGSILIPGHRIVKINGHRCEHLEAMDAFTIIRDSPDFVTVVSRPNGRQDCAIVLSCERQASWWRNLAITGSLAAGAITAARSLI